jgi:geranylgeranyl pyrophosphate synthase
MVPETRDLRIRIRERCRVAAAHLDPELPPTKDDMERVSRAVLMKMGLRESYLGWTMVMLASEYWSEQVAAVPPSRRLFLLPHCLKHAEVCPADYDEFGLDCERCGACHIAAFRNVAEKLGYKVLVAEGSPVVMKLIVSGYIDAIIGVACLNVLEKALDKILLAGIPCMAVPLQSSDCRGTSVDEGWVYEMIHKHRQEPTTAKRTYLHLMRAASRMFAPDEIERLAPRKRHGPRLAEVNGRGPAALDPIAATEAIAYDFLAKGGKHSRPFITLSVYDALTGAEGTLADGARRVSEFSDGVRRTAMSIETFHKASLVHDDIEDDDSHRYGEPTIHREHGIPTAINVGDFLIGLGYRLVSRETDSLSSGVVADVLERLADAHMRLSEGQGAELVWRDSRDKRLRPMDALKIYALKTAPAFEAAFFAGARLAGPVTDYAEPIKQFATNLGVAFQILNDLKDWEGDGDNKMSLGGDVLGGRPTLLWALALESLDEPRGNELLALVDNMRISSEVKIRRVRQLYHEADVFEKAHRLVDKYQERAVAIADDISPEALRRLLQYLIDTVLDRGSDNAVTPLKLTEIAVG